MLLVDKLDLLLEKRLRLESLQILLQSLFASAALESREANNGVEKNKQANKHANTRSNCVKEPKGTEVNSAKKRR